MAKSITKKETIDFEVSISDFEIEDILCYIQDECELSDNNQQRVIEILEEYGDTKVFCGNDLNTRQKLELFIEKQENIPIADFIAFFNRY